MAHMMLVINGDVRKEIARIIQNANWNPIEVPPEYFERVSAEEAKNGVVCIDAPEIAPSQETIKDSFAMVIPGVGSNGQGVGVVYTHEEQPGKQGALLCRHLSVRMLKSGTVVNPEIVSIIATEFGFIHGLGELVLWLDEEEVRQPGEEKKVELTTVNILEPLEGGMNQLMVKKEAVDS